jgi:hypothetical protein
VEVLVAAVLQLTEIVNQTGIGIEIEIAFPVGEIVSTSGPDVGLNLLYVIPHGIKIQVNYVSLFRPGVSKFSSLEESFRLSYVGWAAYLIHAGRSCQWQSINSYASGTMAVPVEYIKHCLLHKVYNTNGRNEKCI